MNLVVLAQSTANSR